MVDTALADALFNFLTAVLVSEVQRTWTHRLRKKVAQQQQYRDLFAGLVLLHFLCETQALSLVLLNLRLMLCKVVLQLHQHAVSENGHSKTCCMQAGRQSVGNGNRILAKSHEPAGLASVS